MHVLSTPPAFVLSQDQTLHKYFIKNLILLSQELLAYLAPKSCLTRFVRLLSLLFTLFSFQRPVVTVFYRLFSSGVFYCIMALLHCQVPIYPCCTHSLEPTSLIISLSLPPFNHQFIPVTLSTLACDDSFVNIAYSAYLCQHKTSFLTRQVMLRRISSKCPHQTSLFCCYL